MLAHLRNGDTYARLAAGFAVGTATAWRYVREAIDLLAAVADDLQMAMKRISKLAYAILDGTLVPIDRIAEQKPYNWRQTQTPRCERPGQLPTPQDA